MTVVKFGRLKWTELAGRCVVLSWAGVHTCPSFILYAVLHNPLATARHPSAPSPKFRQEMDRRHPYSRDVRRKVRVGVSPSLQRCYLYLYPHQPR